MTITLTPEVTDVVAPFRPIFARIAEGAVARDADRELPYAQIRELAAAGFGALRVPIAEGGSGASLAELFAALTELAAADSNITQALRGHFAFIEDRLVSADARSREIWLRRAVDGELIGNAWSEISGERGVPNTVLRRTEAGLVLDGEKFYTTGSIFARWSDVYAREEGTDRALIVAVDALQDGVSIVNDWDGFGQRTTGSGTATYTAARVQPEDVIDFGDRFGYQTAFYQAFHLATLGGIARAATTEAATAVRDRSRSYSHGNAARASEDPQLQQVIGQASAEAYAVEAITDRVARALDRAAAATLDVHATAAELAVGDADPGELASAEALLTRAVADAEHESAAGQVAAVALALSATTRVFDALGASAIREGAGLDRHWRNARAVSSHNPWVYKAKLVGRREVTGEIADGAWSVGTASPEPEGISGRG